MPFTVQQFFQVFASYNEAIWPAQIALYLIALISIFLLIKPSTSSDRLISLSLAFFFGWMGIVYHLLFFSRINPAAFTFAGLFVIQCVMLFYQGVIRRSLKFAFGLRMRNIAGFGLIVYALCIYPLLNYLSGHSYPRTPTFGVPCPTTIFTIGMFLFLEAPFPKKIFIIPIVWSLIASSAAVLLDVPADFALTVAASFVVLLIHNSRIRKGPTKTSISPMRL